MKKRLLILGIILTATSYGEDFFYEDDTNAKGTSVRLEESVISTSGFETTVRNTPKNLTIISNKDIEDKNYSEVSELLGTVPGLTVNQNVFGSFVDLRGQGVDKAKSNVQILVDGVNINPTDPAHGVLPLDTIPVESIERIEVLPGGGSVIYGDGTVGGVVNIITKVEAGKTYNTVGARYGSDATKQFNAAAGSRLTDKLTLQIAYDNKSTNGYRDGAEEDKEYFEGALNYQIDDKNKVTMRYSRTEGEKYTPGSLTRKQIEEDRKQSGATGDKWDDPDRTDLTRDTFSVGYEGKITDRLTFELDTSYQKTENIWSSYMETYPGFFPGMLPSVAQESRGVFEDEKIQVSPKFKYQYGLNSDIIIGFDYKNADSSRTGEPGYLGLYSVYDYDFEKESFAGYIYNTTRVGKFEFAQGYRREKTKYTVDRYSENYSGSWPKPLPPSVTNPEIDTFTHNKEMTNEAYELTTNYLYSDTGNIYARFEGGFRTPAPTELIDKDENTGDYSYNDLDAETYKTFEMGLKDFVGNSFVGVTVFYTETKDEIIQTGDMPNDWAFYNIGKTERKGVEFSAEQYFGKLTISEAFTIVDAQIKESSDNINTEGNKIPGVSKYTANLGAKYDFTTRFNVGANLAYKSGYYIEETNESGEVNSHTVTDITINYNFDSGLKLYTGINNLFNKKYYDSVSSSGNSGYVYDPAAERNYYAGFKYSF